MKRISYFWPYNLTKYSSLFFLTQVILYSLGVAQVREGMEWVFKTSGFVMFLAIIYSIAAITLNALNAEDNENGT